MWRFVKSCKRKTLYFFPFLYRSELKNYMRLLRKLVPAFCTERILILGLYFFRASRLSCSSLCWLVLRETISYFTTRVIAKNYRNKLCWKKKEKWTVWVRRFCKAKRNIHYHFFRMNNSFTCWQMLQTTLTLSRDAYSLFRHQSNF